MRSHLLAFEHVPLSARLSRRSAGSRAMSGSHAGMGVTGPQFDALVEDLVGALDKLKVAPEDKATLLGALGPMRKDVVEK